MMAKKRNLKNLGRRGLSLFLSLVMILSLIQISAFAAGNPDSYVSQQGVEKYYDADGNEVGETGDWSVKLLKTAEETKNPNEFEITLSVETASRIVDTERVVGADVVLVFDLSGSMDQNGRWSALKTAADTLLAKLLPAGTKNRVAIAGYAKTEATMCNFTSSISKLENSYHYNSASATRDKYSGITGTGTNCQGGFRAAEALLSDARSDSLKYVVYMSDGQPTRYYQASNSSTSVVTGGKVSDQQSEGAWVAVEGAQKQAEHLKSKYPGTKLITVGLGIDSNAVMDPDHSYQEYQGIWPFGKWVTIYDGNTAVDEFHKGTTSNINSIYDSIATQITLEATPWTVYDPMSSYVNLSSSVTGNNVETDQNGRRIVWDLLKSTPKNNVYTYSYTVTLNQDNMNVWGADKKNPTNATTQLVYKIVEKDNHGNVTESHDAVTVNFDVPKVTAIPYTVTLEYYVDGVKNAGATETVTMLAGSKIELDQEPYQKSWPYTTFINRTMSTPEGESLSATRYTIDSSTHGDVICYNYKSGYPLTINYLDQATGNVLADQHYEVLKTNDTYSVDSPDIEGYELVRSSQETVAGAMGKKPIEINVYYKRSPYTVTYEFTGDVPTGIAAPTDETIYYFKDRVTVQAEPEEPQGYTFEGWTVDGQPVSGTFEMPAGNVTVYGNWVIDQYDLDVIYEFASEDDLNDYLDGKEAAGDEAVAQIEEPEQGPEESDEDFSLRYQEYEAECKDARAAAEEAYEADFNAGEFHRSYKAADGKTYSNVFVKNPIESFDYNYSYSFQADSVPNFKVTAATGTSGRLTGNTTVRFTLANDLFQLTVNHYKQVKESGDGTVTVDGQHYILADSDSQSLNSGDPYTVEEQEYTGFLGVEGNAEKLGEQSMPEQDVSVDLYYDAQTYIADFTFVGDGSFPVDEPEDQSGLWYGDYVTAPEGMSADGWTFDGWYTAEDCTGSKYAFTASVTDDVHLYGKWTQKEYGVTYHFVGQVPTDAQIPTDGTVYYFNDSIGSNAPDTSAYSEAYDIPAVDYTFDGWYTDASCSGVPYDFSTPITGNVDLYGVWTSATQTYTFTVEHYYEGSSSPFLTEDQSAVDFGYQITDDAAASYKLGSSALAEKLGHQFAQFDRATGCTISDDEDSNVVKCYYRAKEFTLTIHYVYQDQTEAAPTYAESVKYDSGFRVGTPDVTNYHVESVTVETPDGFELSGGTHAVSGTMPGQDVTVKVVYKQDTQYHVTVNYLLKDSTEKLADPFVSGGYYSGSDFDIDEAYTTGKVIEHYSYDSHEGDLESPITGNRTINIYFTRDAYTVNVVHLDGAEGAPNQAMFDLQNTTEQKNVGEEFTHAPAANLPADYKLAGDPTIVGATGENGVPAKGDTITVTYTYLPKGSAAVTVNYVLVDDEGNSIRTLDSNTTGHKEGDSYDVMPDITSFEAANVQYSRTGEIEGTVSGTLRKDEHRTITVKYTLNDYAFSVEYYVDSAAEENKLDASGLNTSASAPYGTELNEELVARYLENEGWLNALLPSGYNTTNATYVTVGVDASSNVVKVVYTYEGGSVPTTYYDVTVNYYNQSNNQQIAPSHTERLSSGSDYNVSAYDAISIAGYTYVETTGDALIGSVTGDKTVNVWYTANATDDDDDDDDDYTPPVNIPNEDVPTTEQPPVVDIPTEEVPKTDLPAIDLPDEEVPLADVPATGDSLMAWVMAAAVSGIGLAWLVISGRKRKEDEIQ